MLIKQASYCNVEQRQEKKQNPFEAAEKHALHQDGSCQEQCKRGKNKYGKQASTDQPAQTRSRRELVQAQQMTDRTLMPKSNHRWQRQHQQERTELQRSHTDHSVRRNREHREEGIAEQKATPPRTGVDEEGLVRGFLHLSILFDESAMKTRIRAVKACPIACVLMRCDSPPRIRHGLGQVGAGDQRLTTSE
jgi:hypothetical protein